MKNENCECMCYTRVCVCALRTPTSPPQHPPCHFQLQRAPGLCHSITQLTRPHLLDAGRQSAINTLIHGETRPAVHNVVLRICCI